MEQQRNYSKTGRNGILRLFILIGFIICTAAAHAQEGGPESANQSKDPPSSKAQKKQQKAQRAREKQQEKARKEALKEHMKHQTPEVRKRMKKDAKEANLNNEHKREFFLKRWFSKKKAP